MGQLITEVSNIGAQVQNLTTLVQTLLNSMGQEIDVETITQQIQAAVQEAVADILAQVEGLDVSALRSDVDQVVLRGIGQALLSAGLAHKEIEALTSKYIQHGSAALRLYGVNSGCAVTKSTNATRNLHLAAGVVFGDGALTIVPEQLNGTTIHNNPGAASQICEVYVINDGVLDFRTTPFGETTPANGWPLYRVTVPAGNTEANDQYLENVTLTDIRKLESGYPNVLASEPFVYVPLRYALPSVDYGVILEVQSYVGSAWQLGDVYAADKTVNGFKIKTNGACDRLVVRWTLLAKRGAAVNGA